ncbi:MAG TPA: molybdopterin cofactor-binding domain-containing protein [Vicinamibacterales bacterium]|nr:molybdopterin cofactor-binding domain-containing protein [Vicinamibacterales bacterium]
MTPAGVSRRTFLRDTGVMVVAFASARHFGFEELVSAQGINGRGSTALDAWIAITADGRVQAYTGKCELGQGLYTAQMQLVAEELDVPVSRVTLTMCDTASTPDQGTTSGAQSHPANFNQANLALACATAREALVTLAAERLATPAADLATGDGAVFVKAAPARRATYGDLVGGRKFMLNLDSAAKRKKAADWKVLGTSVPRLELPAMVTAQLEYVHNVRVPGMLHGRVVRPPSVGATVSRVDETSVRGMPGLVRVVVRRNFVGVVAEKPFQAAQIAEKLQVTWTPGPAIPAQATYYDHLRADRASRDTYLLDSGDVDQTMRGATRVVSATYLHPFHMHGSVGSSCAVADVQPGKATLWSATQAVYPMRDTAALLLGLPADQVRVVFTRGSGCYGINGADTVTYDAALLSQAVGRPVRVQLTRRDEMAWENFGNAFVIDQRAALDASGTIVAWDYEAWSPALGGRPGYDSPGNVVTGWLAGFTPAAAAPRTPAPPPATPLNNNLNTAPSYVTGCVGTVCRGTGTVRSERVLSHRSVSPFFTGPLRAPERFQNTFAHESFMDELAFAAKADPVEFRLKHLRDERLRTVVRSAAEAANWDARPSPPPGVLPNPSRGRGISCVLYEGDNGYVAIVAEVVVNAVTGLITVTRLVGAQDCGPISNPDGVKNQFEGGALHGMSRALFEEVSWNDQRVTSVDWRGYRTFAVGSRTPVVESVLVHQPSAPANGAGETAITVVAAAIGNAVFDATGARLREIPFTPERVKAALSARGTA